MKDSYFLLNQEDVIALLDVFASEEEYMDFFTHLLALGEELRKLSKKGERATDEIMKAECSAKAVVYSTFFFRQNIELIRDLVAALKYERFDKSPTPSKKTKKKPKE